MLIYKTRENYLFFRLFKSTENNFLIYGKNCKFTEKVFFKKNLRISYICFRKWDFICVKKSKLKKLFIPKNHLILVKHLQT